jgi:uncharacterized protein involved in outer membrane biogenesis
MPESDIWGRESGNRGSFHALPEHRRADRLSAAPLGGSPCQVPILSRRGAIWVFGLLGGIVLILGAAALLLTTVDLGAWIEKYESASLDGRLTIGSLKFRWGNPLTVEFRDVRLASPSWGSSPEMVRIDSGSAAIDPWSLWGGPLRFEKLEVVNPVIILERNAEGTGNWAMGAAASIPSPPVPPVASTYAANRLKIPTLIDVALRGGNIRFRTSSGQWLRIELDDLKIRADGADRPLSSTVDGAYNDQRGKLTAEGESFDALRDPSHPYGISFSIANPSTSIGFKGTLIDPLAFDGVEGALKMQVQRLGDLLKIFDAETNADIPLQLAGALTRAGGHWKLSDASGKLAGNAFTGALTLEEAARGQTDNISLDLAFPQLDLDPILVGVAKPGSAKSADWRMLPLQLEEKRGTNIAWRIAAKLLTYAKTRIADVALRGHIAGGEMALEQVKLAFAGGTFNGSASVKNAPGGGHVVAQAALSGIDVAQLSRSAGAPAGQIAGRLDGALSLDMSGATLKSALGASRGHAVLALTQAQIARAVLEKISTDLRSFFRKREGTVPVSCLLGVVDFKNGIGTIWPLELRTPDATLVGYGRVDFPGQHLDLTVQSVAASTSFFALDIPVSISGNIRNLHAQEAEGPPISPKGIDPLHGLPANMRALAQQNPCLR